MSVERVTECVGNEAFGYVDPDEPIDVTLGFGSFKVVFEKARLVDVTADTLTFDALINGRWRRLSVDHPYDPDREPYRAEVTFVGDACRELPIPAGGHLRLASKSTPTSSTFADPADRK